MDNLDCVLEALVVVAGHFGDDIGRPARTDAPAGDVDFNGIEFRRV